MAESLVLPQKLRFLMEPHPYKVVHSGRYGLKSHSCAGALVVLAAQKPLRLLCAREFQSSIDESVHELLKFQIQRLGFEEAFHIERYSIICKLTGSEFIFTGLAEHNAASIKSYEGVDICWVEEAQTVSKRSWDMLIPTIRKPGNEMWVTFNPDLDTDDTWVRWIENPPPGAIIVQTNWRDAQAAGWFPEQENQKRLHCLKTQPLDYPNIWEGECRHAAEGAIFANEVAELVTGGRYMPLPYNPTLPVHCVWDLGWNDKMVVILVQKPVPTVVNVINYFEDDHRLYSEVVDELDRLNYRFGVDWVPHDARQKNAQTGKDARQTLRGLGRKRVRVMEKYDVDETVRQTRMMFPRIYMDSRALKTRKGTGYLGCARLLECLKRASRIVPKATDEPSTLKHDQYLHGADAFRHLGMIVDRIRNDGDEINELPKMDSYRNLDPGMGLLG